MKILRVALVAVALFGISACQATNITGPSADSSPGESAELGQLGSET